jgi:hypothetical protein
MPLFISKLTGTLEHNQGLRIIVREDQTNPVMNLAGQMQPLTVVKNLYAQFRNQSLPLGALLQARQIFYPDPNDPLRTGTQGVLKQQVVDGVLTVQAASPEDMRGNYATSILIGNPLQDVGSSVPYAHSGIIERTGESYVGAQRQLRYASFDTDTNVGPNKEGAWDEEFTDPDSRIRAHTISRLGLAEDIDALDLCKALFAHELRTRAEHNVSYFEYVPAELRPPWPGYASYPKQGAHKKIVAMIRDGGFNPRAVLAYEQATNAYGEYVEREIEAYIEASDQKQAEDEALSGTL